MKNLLWIPYNRPKWKLCRGKPQRPHKSHDNTRHDKRSRRWSRKCETINTKTLQSQLGHQKYSGCHWDHKKYNWALRVHKVWVKYTPYRHFLDVGHIYSVVCGHARKCTWPQVEYTCDSCLKHCNGSINISCHSHMSCGSPIDLM